MNWAFLFFIKKNESIQKLFTFFICLVYIVNADYKSAFILPFGLQIRKSVVKIHDTHMGPSGKKKVHQVDNLTKKEAKDKARNDLKNGGKGTPVKHTQDMHGGKHFHNGKGKVGKGKGTKNYGGKAGKKSNNVHYNYEKPKKK